MKEYFVSYLVIRGVTVEADSFEEACRIAEDDETEDIACEAPMCITDTETGMMSEFYERPE